MPTEDEGRRDDLLLGSNMRTLPGYRPDIDRLRAAPTRIVIGVGAASNGELAHRGGLAVAELLGTAPVDFPGDHGGFASAADAFAVRLREVLVAHDR